MELLSPACFVPLSSPQRLEQLYLAYGGTQCFTGRSRTEQFRMLAEQIGIDACIYSEVDFYRAWLGFLDPTACSDQALDALQGAVYALLYAQAGDTSLVSPACFYGLSPDLRDQAIFAVSGGGGPVVQTEFFLSSTGDDSNAGTEASPWRSLSKVNASSFSAGDSIFLEGGQRFEGPLSLASSGSSGNPIAIGTYGTGTATISGGVVVDTWTLVDAPNNIWRAAFTAATGRPRALFVDGIRVSMARKVADLPSGTVATSTGYDTSGSVDPNYLVGASNLTDIEFAIRIPEWTVSFIQVAAAVNGAITMHANAWASAVGWLPTAAWVLAGLPDYILNSHDILTNSTAPGMYQDRTSNFLYMRPPIGVADPNDVEVIAPVLETIVSGNGNSHIIFGAGIALAHTTNLQPSGTEGYVEVQANTTTISHGSLVANDAFRMIPYAAQFTNCTDIVFDRPLVEHLGGGGINFDSTCVDCEVGGAFAWDISGNGLTIGNPAQYTAGTQPVGTIIHDSMVFLTARELQGGVALAQWYADSSHIYRNEAHTQPYTVATIGWGWGREIPNGNLNNIFEYNRLTAGVGVLKDGGLVYFNSQQLGNLAQFNDVSDIRNPSTERTGLYLDNRTEGLTVENNLVRRTGYAIKLNDNNPGNNTIQNNTSDAGNYFTLGTNNNTVQENVDEVGEVAADADSVVLGAGITAPYADILTRYYPIEHSLPSRVGVADADTLNLSEDAAVSAVVDKYWQVQWTQATGSKQPHVRLSSFNGHASMHFDGGDRLVSTTLPAGQTQTAWAVFQADKSDGTGIVFSTGSGATGCRLYLDGTDLTVVTGSTNAIYNLGAISTQKEIVVVRQANSHLSVWRNGTLVVDHALQIMNAPADGVVIGASYADDLHFTGKVAAFGVLDIPLDYQRCEALIAELAPRYGVTWAPPVTTGLILDLDASLASNTSGLLKSSVNGYDAIADSGSTLGAIVANELNGLSVFESTASQTKLRTPIIEGSVGTIVMVFGKISSYGVAPGVGGFESGSKRVGTVYATIDQMFGGNGAEFFTTGFTCYVNGVATDVIDHTTYNIVILTKSPVAANARFCLGDNLTNGTMTFRIAQLSMYAETHDATAVAADTIAMQSKWGL